MDTENTTIPTRSLSDQQAVDQLLVPSEPEKPAKRRQAAPAADDDSGEETAAPAARGNRTEAPPEKRETDEQAVDSLLEEEGDEPDQEQEATDEDDLEADEYEDEHSEESVEETEEPREVAATDVIFHDPEGNPVTVEEAHRGYLRQADYTRKTQELAQQRQSLEKAYQARETERQVLAENINMALSVVEPVLAEYANWTDADWDRLATEDAQRYAQHKARFEQATVRYQKFQAMGQKALEQAEEERQAKLSQHLKLHSQLAQRLIPELADPQKAPQLKARMKAYLTKAAGYRPEEASRITDARMLNLVYKALQFDMLQARNKDVRSRKVKDAPRRALKAGKPTSQAQRQARAQEEKMKRLRRTGRIEDGVDLLLEPRS